MKYLYIIIFFFIPLTVLSQQNSITVDYTHHIHMKSKPSATIVNARLKANSTISNYEMDFVGNLNFVEEEAGVEGGSVLSIKPKNNPKIFKNFKERKIYSIERVLMKPFFVKDSMSLFDWKINDNKKDILGYICQQATTHYRGRDYIAYFTTKIPYQTGPWKFCGLPGIILSIESKDTVFKINANKIVIKKGNDIIDNPFDYIDLTPISWQEYIDEYERKFYELKNYRGKNGTKISIPERKIETLIIDNSPLIKN